MCLPRIVDHPRAWWARPDSKADIVSSIPSLKMKFKHRSLLIHNQAFTT